MRREVTEESSELDARTAWLVQIGLIGQQEYSVCQGRSAYDPAPEFDPRSNHLSRACAHRLSSAVDRSTASTTCAEYVTLISRLWSAVRQIISVRCQSGLFDRVYASARNNRFDRWDRLDDGTCDAEIPKRSKNDWTIFSLHPFAYRITRKKERKTHGFILFYRLLFAVSFFGY